VALTAEIIRIQDINDCGDIIDRAAGIIADGGLVVYPTDTSYGIGCDARNPDAMERLITVKRRDPSVGLPLLFESLSQCRMYHDFDSLEEILARLFWPGLLTLVVTAKAEVPYHITAGRSSIAIRVPNHVVPRGIADKIGGPIVGTSANRSGGPSPFDITTALEQIGNEVDLYIDGGQSDSTENSTIIGVEPGEKDDGSMNIKIYREGALSTARLSDVLGGDTDAVRYWSTRIVDADM
jgi:L-threonylcarbamoyladenylate synthase